MKGQDIKHLTTQPKRENHKHIKPPTKTNMSGTKSHLSLISLNINVLNSPIERHKLTDWKQYPAFCCMQETHLNNKNRLYLRVKGWKKFSQASGPRKQAGIATLISNKIDFQPKVIRHDGKDTSYSSRGKSTKRKSQF
jgi:hypothetical protein